MAAVGPPQQQVRMAHQQVWAALEVALRVPCLYIIDAIFNSYYDSSQSRFCIGLQIFLRLLDQELLKHRDHIMKDQITKDF
ncbi:E3 ubiquitin-protein ligase RNF139 isoform X7 [Halichoerus grypus]